MADIQSFLDAIQNAVYGEEVRGSIISSLKKVNDDNNSYVDIKTSVLASEKNIKQSVTTFDSLIGQAETKKGELTQEIASAQTSITNLKAVIKESETAKSTVGNLITDVQTQISNCEIASNALTVSINNATTAKTNLDNSITNGNTTKTSIDTVIKNANAAKDNLQQSITASDTAKGNLDTLIATADIKQQALLSTIDTSDKSKQALQTKIDEAQETLKKFPEGMVVAWANTPDGTDEFTRTYPDEGIMKYIGLSVKDSTNPIDYVWLMSDQYVDSLKLDKSGGNITGKLTVKEKDVLVVGDLDTDLSDKLSKKDGGTISGAVDIGGSFRALGGLRYVSEAIPANTDLNTYTEAGEYKCSANATVTTLKNCPTGSAFHLTIKDHAGTRQTLETYDATIPKTYFRNYYNGTWGAWNEIKTREEKVNYGAIQQIDSLDAKNANNWTTWSGWIMGCAIQNAPTAAWYFILNLRHNEKFCYQIALPFTGASFVPKRRNQNNGTWSAWSNLV